MRTTEISKVLKDTLTIQEELLDLIRDFCNEVFKDQGKLVYNMIIEDINCIEFNGCMQGLACHKSNVAKYIPKEESASNRKEELKAIYRFIDTCDTEELALIVEEIRVCHDNLMAFNKDTALFAKIESVCINGESIQLNIERDCSNNTET